MLLAKTFRRALCTLTVLIPLEPAVAEKTFSIAVTTSPQLKGNAIAGAGVSANFIWYAFYDSLTRITNDGAVEPWLATGWKAVSDTEWHFTLRPNVRFANGEPFDAYAVKYTFDMLRDDSASSFIHHRDMTHFPRVDVIDDLTVSIHTNEPNAMAPAYLSAMKFGPRAYLQEVGFQGLVENPIGTGPFWVEHWGPDKITARANPHAWTPPLVDALEILVVPDSTARVQALLTNQVDVALAISTDQIDQLKIAGHKTATRTAHRIYVMALQTEDPTSPFTDVRVRQAINYAVNKDILAKVLLAGLVEPASQPAVPLAAGYDPDLSPYPYDPEKAELLLQEAGFDNGFTFSMESVTNFMPNDTAILQQIQSDLKAVRIDMKINVVTYPTMVRSTLFGELTGEAMTTDFFNTMGDALRPFLYTVNHACGGVRPWYCNETIQPIIEEARVTMDMDRRTQLTKQVLAHYRDDAASLFLFPVLGLDGVHQRVSHWEPWLDVLNYHLVNISDDPSIE